jgi:transposase-like protein
MREEGCGMSTELRMEELNKPRKYTVEQKLGILREWEKRGNGVEIAKQYGLHPYTLYRWKKRLEQGAREWLKGSKPKKALALKRLEEENRQLKETLAAVTQELMLFKKETRWGSAATRRGIG